MYSIHTHDYVSGLNIGMTDIQPTGATVVRQQAQVANVTARRHAQHKFDTLDYTYINAFRQIKGVSPVTVMATEKKAIIRSLNRKNSQTVLDTLNQCMSTHMNDGGLENSDQK